MGYPSIGDDGLIGDLQTAALGRGRRDRQRVLLPRVDSRSVFASLLDDWQGGRFALAPVAPATRSGRPDDARLTFTKMLTDANHVGLDSEEIDAAGRQIGKFPQAFTRLALIDAAVRLDDRLDHPPGSAVPRAETAGHG